MTPLFRITAFALSVALFPLSAHADMTSKELVVTALNELFIKGDVSALDRYWADRYIQHNPQIPNGHDALKGMISNMPPGFKYEMGMVVAEGDLVAVHGRYSGFGNKPMIAVDLFSIEDGKIAEHWDVLQEEVTQTASGNPMFTPAKQ